MSSQTNLIPSGEETIVRYTLDSTVSRFRVQAFASGLLSTFGHNPVIAIRRFSGEATFDSNLLEQSSLDFAVDTKSFELETDVSAKDRNEIMHTMHDEVLQTGSYPEIRYESSSVSGSGMGEGRYRIVLDGRLTLHGVTRPQNIVASLFVIGDTCRATGDFTIRQSDYKIKLVSAVGGALKVKDDVKCTFDVVARKVE